MYTETSTAHVMFGCRFAADCQTEVTTTAQEALAANRGPAAEDANC